MKEQYPSWYVNLDDESRKFVNEILSVIHNTLPDISREQFTRIFWRTLKHMGIDRGIE